MAKHKYIGSDFDDFLKGEGILKKVEAAAAKRTSAIQSKGKLKAKKFAKSKTLLHK